MKIIDIFNKLAKGEKIPKFRIDDERYIYFEQNGYLMYKKHNDEPKYVEWSINDCWLNRKIQIVGDKE